MKDIQPYSKILREKYLNETNPDLEAFLLEIRGMGASQIESVRVLKEVMKLSLSEADEIVLNSKTWKDQFEGTIKLRDSFFEGLIESEKQSKNLNEKKGDGMG